MSEKKATSAGTALIYAVIGIALMIGGMWLYKNWHPEFLKSLEEQGILLNPGKTVAVIGVFLILFKVIEIFYLTPLRDAIDTRNGDLERTFTEAENLRAEMTQMKSDYEKRLADTEAKAREQIQTQIREAQDLRKNLMSEASARADELVKRAQDEIAGERAKALADIRLQVTNLSLLAAERILGESVDTDKNRKLIDDFIDKAEVPSA